MDTNAKVVVVEDDNSIADLLRTYLTKECFEVSVATQGAEALALIAELKPNIVVLDLNLPGALDGLDVCRALRKTSDTPIVMVTARDAELDRVLGLELGADDYVTKPFSPRELTARIKSILRRYNHSPVTNTDTLTLGGVVVDQKRRVVTLFGEPVALTTREFDLLAFLLQNRGLVLTRKQLLDGVWGPEWYGDDRTVDVHVRQLRKKLTDEFPLATVWGVGYRLD
ncbi:two-component system, OmpR family, alkaline phosphatase synthesis response regulator PhoP [Ferrithrix thermotolerans DSM 19514]|uniref:Two-component system, OmpR family, alkaline phosphatase synthesis response regulator PhoP n=1 Tax=Ferrithrix thermotolerans DSM 19514 TaxID=1121881 RepID=A0A1M4SE98_9ACTN|nr:response regulator transcription factor [Ferrithrix thermotolerans]SHE30526.1 two-component system, OmpR family, alkaline phosphatase synthesis response regulator PhoP [Ferrithrix thermotolerans DSM 19514]